VREDLKANPPINDFSPPQHDRRTAAKNFLYTSPSAFPQAEELFLIFQ
jgi:hypothetical protein